MRYLLCILLVSLVTACISNNSTDSSNIGSANSQSVANSDGDTALINAAYTGDAETVKLLINNGVDVNATGSFVGRTALMWATDEGPHRSCRIIDKQWS